MTDLVVAIPVKPFGVAKARLAPVLDRPARRRLGQAVLAHTMEVAARAGGRVVVVTADPTVAAWVEQREGEVVEEDPELGAGLDGAARSGVAAARRMGMPWAVLHADLPLVEPGQLARAFGWAERTLVLAPSRDRGTNLVAGPFDDFPFSYGPDSFGRHMAAATRLLASAPVVLISTGLALDLDGPSDLEAIRRHRRGAWLEAHLA